MYLGDFAEDATLDFKWSSNGADGASITRGTNGTISVYIGNGTTEVTAGVTDTEDFDGLTGVHHCRIDLSADAAYVAGAECQVVLSGAVIDGQTVNTVLASFSIERAGGVLAMLKAAFGGTKALDNFNTYFDNADTVSATKLDDLGLIGNAVVANGVGIGQVYSRLGAPAGASMSDDIAAVPAAVKPQVVAALTTDTYGEPAQGAPAATLSLAGKIAFLYKAWRNKSTQTDTEYALFADDGTTVDQKATVGDSGGTLTRGEIATGP